MKTLSFLNDYISLGLIRNLELYAEDHQCIFWIRDQEFEEQLYVSATYQSIFGRSPLGIYRDPDSWKEALHVDNTETFFNELKCNRILINPKYTAVYCIHLPDENIRWMIDRSIHLPTSVESLKLIIGCCLAFAGPHILEQKSDCYSEKLDLHITAFSRMLTTSICTTSTEPIEVNVNIDFLKNLSKRELEIFKLFIQANTITQVAELLHLSPRTVEGYLTNLKTKLNCDSKSELVMKAIENGCLLINI